MNRREVVKAFAICPLVPAIALAIINGVMGAELASIPIGVFVYLPFSYFMVLLFGVPMFLALSTLKRVSYQAYGFGGALTGFIIALVMPTLMLGRPLSPNLTDPYVALFSAVGCITSLVFRRLAFGSVRN